MNSCPQTFKDTQDQIISQKIELFIQYKENVTIPCLVFEYLSKDKIDFEYNDIRNFYEQFGEIDNFELFGKICIILYKTFFSANICRKFLQNENNFKDNKKNMFIIRWFNQENDKNLLPLELKDKFFKISNNNFLNLQKNNINMAINVNMNINMNNVNNLSQNLINNNNNYLQQNNFNNFYNNYLNNAQNNVIMINLNKNNFSMQNFFYNNNNNNNNNKNNINNNNVINQAQINNMLNINNNFQNNNIYFNSQSFNNNNNNNINIFENKINSFVKKNSNKQNLNNNKLNNSDEKVIKYTCKYEILIPNDKDFQIARRLIGSKGCNMKKILEECKKIQKYSNKSKQNFNNTNNNFKNNNNFENENVKLRLRGQGSGYKEGPKNEESSEPLHLCISTRTKELMKKACELVNELFNKIYEEYKKHCNKLGINPISKLAVKIENKDNDLRKNSLSSLGSSNYY